jgi:hypothetical protein
MNGGAAYIRKHVIEFAVINSLFSIFIGLFGPQINPHISVSTSLPISIISSFVLSSVMIRSAGGYSYPPSIWKWFLVGALWGALWGVTPGLIIGWREGHKDLGTIHWLVRLVAALSGGWAIMSAIVVLLRKE